MLSSSCPSLAELRVEIALVAGLCLSVGTGRGGDGPGGTGQAPRKEDVIAHVQRHILAAVVQHSTSVMNSALGIVSLDSGPVKQQHAGTQTHFSVDALMSPSSSVTTSNSRRAKPSTTTTLFTRLMPILLKCIYPSSHFIPNMEPANSSRKRSNEFIQDCVEKSIEGGEAIRWTRQDLDTLWAEGCLFPQVLDALLEPSITLPPPLIEFYFHQIDRYHRQLPSLIPPSIPSVVSKSSSLSTATNSNNLTPAALTLLFKQTLMRHPEFAIPMALALLDRLKRDLQTTFCQAVTQIWFAGYESAWYLLDLLDAASAEAGATVQRYSTALAVHGGPSDVIEGRDKLVNGLADVMIACLPPRGRSSSTTSLPMQEIFYRIRGIICSHSCHALITDPAAFMTRLLGRGGQTD